MDQLSTKIHPRTHTDKNLYLISRGISNSLKSIQMTWVRITRTEAMKLKNCCPAKDLTVKRQSMGGRKYLQIIYVNKWLMSKFYEGLPLQPQKHKQPNLEIGQRTSSHFSKKAPQTSSRIEPTKSSSASLIARGMQIKTIMRYHTSYPLGWPL